MRMQRRPSDVEAMKRARYLLREWYYQDPGHSTKKGDMAAAICHQLRKDGRITNSQTHMVERVAKTVCAPSP